MTGMRLGECLAMKTENLDIANAQYVIREKVRHGTFGRTKTGGERLVDLTDDLVMRLQSHIRWLKAKMLAEGSISDLLFPGITERIIQTALKRASMSARLRTRTPHDLRHTYATILLMDHYSPAYVQRQLGHHLISMTVDIYGHWVPGVCSPGGDS
jgi:integrase